MAYRLRLDAPLADDIRRLAAEQVDSALAETRDGALTRERAIHQARKRCKKIRAVLRLVRPSLGTHHRRDDRLFRDAARRLADARDAGVVVATYDKLLQRLGDDAAGPFAPLRELLERRRERLSEADTALEAVLARFRDDMAAARARIDRWSLDDGGFRAFSGGLKNTYAQARKLTVAARAQPSVEGFHEWRKAVKYHWYHVRLLTPLWPVEMRARSEALHTLSELLGEEHDLAVLRAALAAETEHAEAAQALLPGLVELLEQRREELQGEARALGQRLFAEKPKHLAYRLRAYWRAAEPVAA